MNDMFAVVTTLQVTQTTSQTPLLLPGLFTAASSEPIRPVDRVYFNYGYFDDFRVSSGGTVSSGFNLNRFDVGLEKTFFDGLASAYVRIPFLNATQNSSALPIDGLGDVTAGFKAALWTNEECGSVISAGLSVSAPTARDTVVTNTTTATRSTTAQLLRITPSMNDPSSVLPRIQNGTPIATINGDPTTSTTQTRTTINPTFLQPWLGGLLVRDRLFIQEYFGVVVPTDDRVATFINNDFNVGYEVYRNRDGLVRFVSLTSGVQLLIPVNNRQRSGTGAFQTVTSQSNVEPLRATFMPNDPDNISDAEIRRGIADLSVPPNDPTLPTAQVTSFGFPDQVFLSEGVQFGLGERAVLSSAVVVPVAGPRAFSVGGVVGFNLFY